MWELEIIFEDSGDSMVVEFQADTDDEAELIDLAMHYISIVPLRKIEEEED